MPTPADLTKRRLDQARRLLAIAQTGLHYTTGVFDRERYQELLGLAQAQLADLADVDTADIAQIFVEEKGYANPKIDVRCAVFNDQDQVLLVREAADGRWSLPGGWADVGTSPAENAVREVREESGYVITVARLLAVWDLLRHPHPPSVFHTWKFVFLGNIVASGDISGEETDAVGFFPIDALPPLSLGRILPEQIRTLSELRRNGDMQVD